MVAAAARGGPIGVGSGAAGNAVGVPACELLQSITPRNTEKKEEKRKRNPITPETCSMSKKRACVTETVRSLEQKMELHLFSSGFLHLIDY